jgi:hypothetical protein
VIEYVSTLIEISKEKCKITEEYTNQLSDGNNDFFVIKKNYESKRLILDDKFLKYYMELLSKEGVLTIGELDKKKYSNLKELKDIVGVIENLEKNLTKLENDVALNS